MSETKEMRWVSAYDDAGTEHIINPARVRYLTAIVRLSGQVSGSRITFSDHDVIEVEMTPDQFTDCAGVPVHEISAEDDGPSKDGPE